MLRYLKMRHVRFARQEGSQHAVLLGFNEGTEVAVCSGVTRAGTGETVGICEGGVDAVCISMSHGAIYGPVVVPSAFI